MTKGTDFSTIFSHDTTATTQTPAENNKAEILTILNNNFQEQNPNLLPTTGNFNQEQISILSQLPFWINDPTEHSHIFDDTNQQCCFNHYVGLPFKYGTRLPLFDYEVAERYRGQPSIFQAFENNNCIYVLKATGIGFSDLTLR